MQACPRLPLLPLLTLLAGCGFSPDNSAREPAAQVMLTSSRERATRRLYNGAPPVIPHRPLKIACAECHTRTGKAVPPLGMAPANPHAKTSGLGEFGNCAQCHVFRQESPPLAESDFVGLTQRLAQADRLYRGAPPVMPHRPFMREDCAACHTGPAVRPEIRCSHVERANCRQCHVPTTTGAEETIAAEFGARDEDS